MLGWVLIAMAKSIGMTDVQIKNTIKMRKAKNINEEVAALEELVERDNAKTEHNGGMTCADGEHCGETFKQISEAALLTHLKQGWRVAHNLQNGEIIVKR
jgi:hypothetical protein